MTAETEEVAARVEALRAAMVAADVKTLESLLEDELSYGHSSGRVEGKDEFVGAYASGRASFTSIELTEQSVTITGEIGIVRHRMDATQGGDNRAPVAIRILMVWRQSGGEWLLLARQAVKVAA